MADALGAELEENLVTKADVDAAVTQLTVHQLQTTAPLASAILLLKWMVGFILAFVVAIAWRVFA